MNLNETKEKRKQFLLAIYELAEGIVRDIVTRQAAEKVGINYDTEAANIGQYLRQKGWISWTSFDWVTLTHAGLEEAEKLMEEIYAEKQYRVLKTINETQYKDSQSWVHITDLQKALSDISYGELLDIVNDLQRQGLLEDGIDEAVKISSAGKEALQQPQNRSSGILHVGDVYNATITQSSNFQIGKGNQQMNNQALQDLLPCLTGFISELRKLDFDDKDDVIRDLEKAQSLLQSDDPKSKWELIKLKIEAAKTTLDIAGVVYHTLPYWEAIAQAIFH